jgi:N6-adenosine-specific RNA methylase IME4
MKYRTVLLDPPWNESGGGKIKRGADRHYPLMKTPEILALCQDVLKDKTDDNCHCYLWVTNNFLPDGLEVINALGFNYKTCITWNKDRFGLGQYYRGITEHCLFSVKGNLPYKVLDGKRQQGITGFYECKREHSRKPEAMYSMIEKVSYPPRLELFARYHRHGWDVWGNVLN